MSDPAKLREVCAILGQKHSLEIIAYLMYKEPHVKKIAEDTGIPYTTAQKRVVDMERAGLVTTWSDITQGQGKHIKKVKLTRFLYTISPLNIQHYLEDSE